MATTYETNFNNSINNNNNAYEEVDNNSEKSRDYASSNSSHVDDAKKRNSLISFEDNKDKDDEKNKSKRSKRNSFRKIFTKEEKEEKESKEGKEGKEGGLVRSLSGLFNKDKDKDKDKDKRSGTSDSLRPASRTSSNSQNRRSFIFLSDDDGLEIDTTLKKGRKSRQTSNAEGLEKDNSTKKGNRMSVNLNNLNIGKLLGFDENKSSPKSNEWEDNFLEPEETLISPRSPRNSFYAGSSTLRKNKLNDEYVESPRNIHHDNPIGINGVNDNKPYPRDDTSKSQNNSIDESQVEVQSTKSTNSSTRPSSLDDQYYNQNGYDNRKAEEEDDSPTTPMTPRLFVTRPYPDSSEFTSDVTNDSNRKKVREIQQLSEDDIKEDTVVNSKVESKSDEAKKRNFEHLVISTSNLKSNVAEKITKNDDETITKPVDDNKVTTTSNIDDNDITTPTQFPKNSNFNASSASQQDDAKMGIDEQFLNKFKELENAKAQLEAKVAEQNGEINKFNSMEQIMQQQVELSERMTETMHRLESKQKEEVDNSNVSKIFEDTIQRLEEKIDEQKKELNQLKFIVGQLTGNQNFLIANGDFPRLSITQGVGEENQPSQSHSGNTLVSTLVVNPLCNTITVSATIATSVLYAVYIRPIVGLVGLVSVARNARNTRNEM